MATNFGIDWAGNGWVAAKSGEGAKPVVNFYSTIYEIGHELSRNDRMAIDIPIGLPSDKPRNCDREAKKVLGARGNSVFYTPIRDAVYEPNIEAAKGAQRRLGYSIQNQAWAIVPRIREVDRFLNLHQDDIREDQIVETHPEVAFAALNDGRPAPLTKKKAGGETQRLDLLEPHLPEVTTVYDEAQSRFDGPRYASKLAKPDDILDALVALVVAKKGDVEIPTLPQMSIAGFDALLDRKYEIAYPTAVDWPNLTN